MPTITKTIVFDEDGVGEATVSASGTDELDAIIEFERAAEIIAIDEEVPTTSVLTSTKHPGGAAGPTVPLGDASLDNTQAAYSSNDAHRFARTGYCKFVTSGGVSGKKAVTVTAKAIKGG